MASPRASQLRPLIVLAGFLALWWLAPVAARTFTRATFYEFEAPAWRAYSHAKDLQDFWTLRAHGEADLIEAGRDLARENAALNLQLQENAHWRREAEELAALLKLPAAQKFRYEVARVIRRDQNAWWQLLYIRKGHRQGLAEGQGVVFAGGVVGRLSRVYADTAVVELASSPVFRTAANLHDDPRPVIFQGGEMPVFSGPRGEVRDVASDVKLPAAGPLRLVTSGLTPEFPQGLTLGWVENLAPSSNGLMQSGEVRLDPALSSLREVAVLVPVDPVAFPPAEPASRGARPNLRRP